MRRQAQPSEARKEQVAIGYRAFAVRDGLWCGSDLRGGASFGDDVRWRCDVWVLDAVGGDSLAVAFRAKFEDGGVMDESVDGGDGHGLVGEDGIPVSKGAVAGDDEAAVFVAFGDEFEEDAGFRLVFSDVAKVVKDKAVDAIEFGQQGGQGEVASGGLQSLDEVGGAGEKDAVSGFDESVANGGGDVGFTGAAAAKEQAVAGRANPVAGTHGGDACA